MDMEAQILKTMYGKTATERDLEVIRFFYENLNKPLSDVIPKTPTSLNEKQIMARYFRQDLLTMNGTGKTKGCVAFNYFFVLSGLIKINQRKIDEIKWILGIE